MKNFEENKTRNVDLVVVTKLNTKKPFEMRGFVTKMPIKGDKYHIGPYKTSIVTEELDENNVFKTLNSEYKLEIVQS